MALYEYSARNMQGDLIEGSASAKRPEEVEEALLQKGYYLIGCQPARAAGLAGVFAGFGVGGGSSAGSRRGTGFRRGAGSHRPVAAGGTGAVGIGGVESVIGTRRSREPRPPAARALGFLPRDAEGVARAGPLFSRKPGKRDIAVFCRQFSVLLSAGVGIVETLSLLRRQTENRSLGESLADIHERVQRGIVLSDAMAVHPAHFEEFFVNMVRVGESSGAIDEIMQRLADYYERDNKVSQKTRSALAYPAILAILTVAVVVLLMVRILPMFAGIISQMGGSMPGVTRGLIAVSGFVAANWALLLLVVVALAVAARAFSKTETGRGVIDAAKISLPGVRTVVTKTITARFARSLGILLKSGMPIVGAVDLIARMLGNRAAEKRFGPCAAAIKEGQGISGPLAEMRFFPALLVHMVAIGESSGELDEMLTRTAGFFDLEVEESIDRLTVLVEPLMIIVLGAIVGVVVVSIMLPMITIMTSM